VRGTNYRLTRGRNPNKLYYQEIQFEEPGWTEPKICDQQKVEELWPISYEMFRCTLVLPQFGDLFLDLGPEDQAALFAEPLDLDCWLAASELAGELVRAAEKDKTAAERSLAEIGGSLAELIAAKRRAEEAAASFADEIASEIAFKKTELQNNALKIAECKERKLKTPSQADMAAIDAAIGATATRVREASKHSLALDSFIRDLDGTIMGNVAEVCHYEQQPDRCPECGQKVATKHYQEKIVELQQQNEELEQVRADALAQKVQAERELAAATEQLEQKQAGRALGQQQLAQASANQSILDSLLRQESGLKTEIANIGKKINTHKEQATAIRARMAVLNEQTAEHQAVVAEADSSIKIYEYWKQSYRQIRLDVIDGMLAGLAEASERHADLLGCHGWRFSLSTEKETAKGSTKRGINASLIPPTADRVIKWQSFCGGEAQRWQLAVRFAFSEILLSSAALDPNIEVLDEPTQHLSPKGVEDLLRHLRDRALALGRQVWVIEHHMLDLSLFDGSLVVEHDLSGAHFSSANSL
jgi:DNA repair exonuclease SbcCD ATPase subunit